MNHKEEFIERYKRLHQGENVGKVISKEKTGETQERKKNRFFWGFIIFLGITPFLLNGFFLFILNQYSSILGNELFKEIAPLMDGTQLDELGQVSGLPGLGFMVQLYEERYVIITIIFAFFALIIGTLLTAHYTARKIRNRNG